MVNQKVWEASAFEAEAYSLLGNTDVWLRSCRIRQWFQPAAGTQWSGEEVVREQDMLCHSKKRRKVIYCELKTPHSSSVFCSQLSSVYHDTILFSQPHYLMNPSCFLLGCGTLWQTTMATWCRWTGRHRTLAPYTCPPSTSLSTRYDRHAHMHTQAKSLV